MIDSNLIPRIKHADMIDKPGNEEINASKSFIQLAPASSMLVGSPADASSAMAGSPAQAYSTMAGCPADASSTMAGCLADAFSMTAGCPADASLVTAGSFTEATSAMFFADCLADFCSFCVCNSDFGPPPGSFAIGYLANFGGGSLDTDDPDNL